MEEALFPWKNGEETLGYRKFVPGWGSQARSSCEVGPNRGAAPDADFESSLASEEVDDDSSETSEDFTSPLGPSKGPPRAPQQRKGFIQD